MSRARAVDNSAAVSLFPFLAVLLCTMGALLVVLVAVSRTARNQALRLDASAQQSVAPSDPVLDQKLGQIEAYESFLAQVRTDAEKKLREDQKRVSHLESHMRELQDKLLAAQLAAEELAALEKEHYDDQEQARRDVERLEKLIADTRASIEASKDGKPARTKSYALIPYEGPNGTLRRAIYIECRKGVLILQPEGVQITRDDLRPPIGAGNPLGAALRSARDHYIRLYPGEGQNRESEPYALIVIRPSGADMNDLAQRAIRAADFDFGYELFEEDSDINFGAPDPQLALVEQQAIDHARIRQDALAAAAPRAFRHRALAASGRFEFDDDAPNGFGHGGGSGGSGRDGADGVGYDGDSIASAGGADGNGDAGNGAGGPSAEGGQFAGTNPHGSGNRSTNSTHALVEGNQREGGTDNGSMQAETIAGGTANAGASPNTMGTATPGIDPEPMSSVAVANGAAPPPSMQNSHENAEAKSGGERRVTQQVRGKDWAFRQKNPRDVPISRSISLVVRNDHIAVLSDEARLRRRQLASKTIKLEGDTALSIDELVRIVHEQVDGWGMAGEGLYWRPVLTMHVGPDGQRRAEDLVRLLTDSGLEIRPAGTATYTPEGDSRATRAR
jgi:hypothetical protein